MRKSLRKELADFEKQLGLLLVKVMKISDEVDRIEHGEEAPASRASIEAKAPTLVELAKAYS